MLAQKAPDKMGWFAADTTGVHSYSGPIYDPKDYERIRLAYVPGEKGITKLTITWYRQDGATEVYE
jgi:hypothetical protein